MDKLRVFLNINRKVFVFLFGLMIIGIVFGSCLPLFLSSSDKVLVSDYLSGFINQVYSSVDYFLLFKNSILSNGLFFILIWLLGISVIGVPIILFLFFYKCFIFGFSISSIIVNYGFKGILFSFVYIFPHQVIDVFGFLIITSYSLIFSLRLILLILRKHEFNIGVFFGKYFKILLVCFLLFFISSLYESFVCPHILSFVIGLLGL